MDDSTARELIALNTAFYAEHAGSFSATRSAPWEGWERVIKIASKAGALDGQTVQVLDLACGNMRFERFLADALDTMSLRCDAVDNCAELAADAREMVGVSFHGIDILGQLMAAGPLHPAPRLELGIERAPYHDLAACFGFMHHVPGSDLRRRVLEELLARTRAGGVVAVSFWQFMDDERLARKVAASEASACEAAPWEGFDPTALEPGDHFLGWQADCGALRYCHHFTESEIDELVADASANVGAREVARFSADGSSHRLNRYLVLQRI